MGIPEGGLMNLLLNWLFVIAYFSVFFLGLFGCFYLANNYWSARTVTGNTVFTKRALTLKAVATVSLALCAIGGLFQAMAGV